MNIIHEMETIIKNYTGCDKLSANLASNGILDSFDKLGLDLVEKDKMPQYELMQQSDFEDMIINIIKENETINSNVKAVQRYLELCNNVIPEDCKIDNCTMSIRKGIWEQLIKLGYIAF